MIRYFFLYLFSFFLSVSLLAQQNNNLVIPPFQQAPERKPQYPLKTKSLFYSDSLVSFAKENIRRYPWATSIKDSILHLADKWLSFTDDELNVLMADARVPRGFDLSAKGCPVHGDTIFKMRGYYPWIIDLKHPFHVICPVDSQVFPSNDYAAYYKSDFQEKQDFEAEYADNGFGWVSPEGERYWFVAHANHWTWYNHILPGMLDLARAYLLSGDKRYASQAVFMLYRLASVYPSMNHEDQSRYGLYMKSRGYRYRGKIVNYVWESFVIDMAAEAYDLVWETIDTDSLLQKRTGKTGEVLRAFIEANLLEEAFDAFAQDKALANYGLTQASLLSAHLSRQNAGMEQAIHNMFYQPAQHPFKEGLKYGMYNLILRDGIPYESPGYNSYLVNSFVKLQGRLPEDYKDLLTTFRFKQLIDAPLDLVAIGKYVPDIGDSGTTLGGLYTALMSDTYYQAYNLYQEPRYLPWIQQLGGPSSTPTIQSPPPAFLSLFNRPRPDFPALKDGRAVDIQSSRLFAGYGLGILNNKTDETAVAFHYGKNYSHDHWDYLNIEVFANGQKMIPDMGYPDAMNDLVEGIQSWSINSVSHNVVLVDQRCQERKMPGVLHDFADGGFARTMDASSPAYGNTSTYRRNVIMVDTEDGQSFLVDFFNVCGGKRHDYLLHGTPGKACYNEDEWSAFDGSLGAVTTWQHYFNVSRHKSGKGILEFRHVRDEDARLRIFPLTRDQEIFIADAYDKPRAKEHLLKNLISTRKTDQDSPLESMFIHVFEPYKGDKHNITETRTATLDQGEGAVVVVERGSHTDVIIYDPSGSSKKINQYQLETDAVTTVATFDPSGKLMRAFFSCGSYLHCQEKKFTAEPVKGKVVSVDVLERAFQIEMEGSRYLSTKELSGQIAHFTNDVRTTVHPLSSVRVEGNRLDGKTKDDLLIGYFQIQTVEGNVVRAVNTLTPFSQDYPGATLLDKNFHPLSMVVNLNNGLTTKEPVTSLKQGDEAWLCNIGVGDQMLIKTSFSWETFAMSERKPQYPLKTGSMIYSDSLVSLAKENIQQYAWAKTIRDSMLQRADKWFSLTDDELITLMPDARVPRAFDLSVTGCPVHGEAVFNNSGWYPWTVDLKRPFQVICPIDGQVFPSNDYAAYYKSDFEDKNDWNTDYTDDGWGWLSPDGERYWFVAYANHWIWYGHIVPGILDLARAYMLTGDKRYASQAVFMMCRMASVYPAMNHEDQSRYGLFMKNRGLRYPGKIVHDVWEQYVINMVAEAYDLVWETIDTDISLQKRTGKTGIELRTFIEANLLEEALDGFEQDKILANYGLTQSAMLTLQLSRQHAGMEQTMHKMLYEPSNHPLKDGVKFALYNQIFRDGIPCEAPGYNAFWVNSLMKLQHRLPTKDKDLFSTFRFKQFVDAPLDMVTIGKYVPDIGDSGSVLGGLYVALESNTYLQAFNLYNDPRYLPWLKQLGEKNADDAFQSLFHRPQPNSTALRDERAVDVQPSRLFAGYGLGILNNKSDETAVALTYGKHISHDHRDYLNIEVFANGQKMMPDLGYPDAMNDLVSGIFTWSTNTVAHNTVVVDGKRQDEKLPGVLHDFAIGTFARTMDASSPAYNETSEYRRNIIMVDTEEGQSYFVDFFNVCGGSRHDYSLHGPPGKTYFSDTEWSDIFPSTFAGTAIAPGDLYDDPRLLRQGKEIGYDGYTGSGFQHLFNVRQLKSGKGIIEYRHVNDDDARLRIFPLTQEGEIIMADAYDKPRAKDCMLKYMICTRKANNDKPLKTMFVSVLEPYHGENQTIKETRITSLEKGDGHVVVVERAHHTDVIIYDPSGSTKQLSRYSLSTDAVSTVVTFDRSGKLKRAFFSCGSYLHCKGKKFTAEPVKGKVVSMDALERTFQVEVERSRSLSTEELPGQIAHFTNAYRTTVHPLSTVKVSSKRLDIHTKDDLLIGYFRINTVNGNVVTTDNTVLPFAQDYPGATLLDKNYHPLSVVTNLNNGLITNEPVTSFKQGDEAWLCNIGIGDQMLIKPVFSWEKK